MQENGIFELVTKVKSVYDNHLTGSFIVIVNFLTFSNNNHKNPFAYKSHFDKRVLYEIIIYKNLQKGFYLLSAGNPATF